MRVFVLTDCPSPYQVELFNEIDAQGQCALEVGYLRNRDPERQWKTPEIRHACVELSRARAADLVVFNYYRHEDAERLINERAAIGGPWCFWGERPGIRQPQWAGRLLRRWKLTKLHSSSVPIWGIGEFAIAAYRAEFGFRRAYFNLPYFSDLDRFQVPARGDRRERTFLFCGSLIERKGVDLVAAAFVRLAREVSDVRLRIVGDGELRESLVRMMRQVSERVEFVGFKDWDELPAEYATGDVLCVPSRYDGWGLVVPEGLAAGLPVIATDRMGAALEFIESGRNGWLIRAGDEEALFKAMREAATAPLAEMSCRARKSVSEHTLRNGATRFVDYARRVIASSTD